MWIVLLNVNGMNLVEKTHSQEEAKRIAECWLKFADKHYPHKTHIPEFFEVKKQEELLSDII